MKILRELNATNNLQVVQDNTLETATKVTQINIKSLIFTLPSDESKKVLTTLLEVLRSHQSIAEYAQLRTAIFNEYFESRKYLLESYLHAIGRIFERDAIKASEFIGAFLAKYLELISSE